MKQKLLMSAVLLPVLLSGGAYAQAQDAADDAGDVAKKLDTVTVTANRRDENLQDVPITITAVSGAELEEASVTSLQELTTLVAGYVGPGPTPTLSPQLRGIGSQISAPGQEASVAYYVDGVYIGATSPALYNLSNVAQIEVLKGPQGTLFGRNTTGGLINVTTRDPGDEFAAELEFGYASFDTVSASAYVDLPLSDSVAANFAIERTSMGEGWGTNIATGSPNQQLDEQLSVRSKWNFTFSDTTSFMFIGDYEKHEDTNFFLSTHFAGNLAVDGTIAVPGAPPAGPGLPPTPPTPGTYRVMDMGWDANTFRDVFASGEAYGLTGRLTHDFGFATLTNTLAYRETDYTVDSFTGNLSPEIGAFDVSVFWPTKNEQLTNELQLASNGDGPLDWTIGVFYYDASDSNNQEVTGGPLGPPFTTITDAVKETTSIAPYAQVSYETETGTTFTAGLRYTDEESSLDGTTMHPPLSPFAPPTVFAFLDEDIDIEKSGDSISARLSVAQRLNDQAMIYASYNRGTKTGSFNPVNLDNAPTKDEELDAFEIGTKLDLADGTVRLNAAAYYYDYKNIQLNSFFEPGPPNRFNGPESTLYGLDVDLVAQPTDHLTLTANMNISESEFGDYPAAEFFAQNETVTPGVPGAFLFIGDATGNTLPLSPELTANLGVNYEIPTATSGTFRLNSVYSYSSGFFGTPGNEPNNEQGSFGRLSASLNYSTADDKYFVRVWGKNITDEESLVQANYTVSGPTGQLDAPQTFGITVGGKF